jgi:hypothetical protein
MLHILGITLIMIGYEMNYPQVLPQDR